MLIKVIDFESTGEPPVWLIHKGEDVKFTARHHLDLREQERKSMGRPY